MEKLLTTVIPPPRARVGSLILKKATRALNGPALLFCVQMVKSIDCHIGQILIVYLLNRLYIAF